METSRLMSHPGFGFSACLTRFAPEKPTQLEATVIGSSTLIDQLLPTQLHPPLIQIPNAQVENITTNSVATPQARYSLDHEKGIGGEIREAVQKEINSQDDRLVKTVAARRESLATLPWKGGTDIPVESKDSPDFSHIDSGCSEAEYIGYILDAAGEYEGFSEDSDDSTPTADSLNTPKVPSPT
ncbi:hypothetical protein L211DRAFT_891224 [Terfezia boudieri ATCC MYA-4762]|uniref:Uncharacterized protein n=1 Tax=Terfezia boudieri ATCC MYA-4762 TaxID=1051890 RepID=A0A3N4MG98_9PEZI|nr:hypothetical protein L211DRAFT_891224 [Terfezia boudieri ATCC MYA-4762]